MNNQGTKFEVGKFPKSLMTMNAWTTNEMKTREGNTKKHRFSMAGIFKSTPELLYSELSYNIFYFVVFYYQEDHEREMVAVQQNVY